MKLNPSPRRGTPSQVPDGLVLERFLPYRLSVLMLRISNAIARSYERRFRLSLPEWRGGGGGGGARPPLPPGGGPAKQKEKGRVRRRGARPRGGGRGAPPPP